MRNPDPSGRFLTVEDLARELNISHAQAYALVRSGSIRAIKIGGRGQWRVERSVLEEFIAQAYQDTQDYVRAQPADPDTISQELTTSADLD